MKMHFSFFPKTFSRPALNISRHVRAFHDVKVGDNVLVKKKITPEDVKKFADLTGDHNSVHTRSEKPIVHGAFLNGLVSGVIGTRLPGCGTLVCNQDLKFPEPCHVGEEVVIYVEIAQVRKLVKVKYFVYTLTVKGKKSVLEGSAHLKLLSKQ